MHWAVEAGFRGGADDGAGQVQFGEERRGGLGLGEGRGGPAVGVGLLE